MMRILILGAAGNFGRKIVEMLSGDPNIQLVLGGRNRQKLDILCSTITFAHPVSIAVFDLADGLAAALKEWQADLVIHTAGPFQSAGYDVAEACLDAGCHYVDLADARAFVCGFSSLNQRARDKGLFLCSGASSVPGLSSAILDQVVPDLGQIDSVDYAIATAQRAKGGIATTKAVLAYAGQALSTMKNGRMQRVYGWCDLGAMGFWKLGRRWLGRADIPDLDLFPARYPGLQNHRFRAGMELSFLQWILWLQSNFIRLLRLPGLAWAAPSMMKIAGLFDPFGSKSSGFFLIAEGGGKKIRFDLLAQEGDGLHIPIVPVIVLARKMAAGQEMPAGAMPCMGLVSLQEYLEVLSGFSITWQMRGADLPDPA